MVVLCKAHGLITAVNNLKVHVHDQELLNTKQRSFSFSLLDNHLHFYAFTETVLAYQLVRSYRANFQPNSQQKLANLF